MLIYNSGLVKDPRVFYCPTLDKSVENTKFNYTVQAPNWKSSAMSTFPANWEGCYTSYAIWANQGVENSQPPQSASVRALYPWPTVDPLFNAQMAWRQTSPSTALIASDIISYGTNTNFAVRSNHMDGRSHLIFNALLGAFGTKQLVQGYGGNYLYNDGHVTWRKTEDMQMRYENNGGSGVNVYMAY